MRRKFFLDWRFAAGVIGVLGMGGAYGVVLYYFLRCCIEGLVQQFISPTLFFAVLFICVVLSVAMIWFFRFLGDRTLACLSISESKIVWRALFHLPVTLKIEECIFVGVADMSAHNQGLPIVKGYEESYIYLSLMPLPEKYRHKMDQAKCKKGFIKFAYSDKLCQALIDILPEAKANLLKSLYNRMQLFDKTHKRKYKKRNSK